MGVVKSFLSFGSGAVRKRICCSKISVPLKEERSTTFQGRGGLVQQSNKDTFLCEELFRPDAQQLPAGLRTSPEPR